MADPTQNVNTPALNPGTPVDPNWIAQTPAATTDDYDVVIGNGSTTMGLLLYRGEDGGAPDKVYKTEAVDWEYAGTFVSRTNVGSGFGDDQQDFWMTFTQKDWSGGLGQKYFDANDPVKSRKYWGGTVDGFTVPGSAKGGFRTDTLSAGLTSRNQLLLYYVNAAGQKTGPNCLVNITGNTSNTVVYQYSSDEGNIWTVQTVTNASVAIHDMVDGCVGDDGRIYVLEGIDTTTVSSSTIHFIGGPGTASSLAWDNTTHLTGSNNANCICYWQGGPGRIYVGTIKGQLVQVPLSATGSGTIIKDFGAGTIIDILATPKGIYVLYYGAGTGDYRLFLYDGSTVSEVAKLPKGWRYHPTVEQQLAYDSTTATVATSDALAYQDGVLYVTGLMPARDIAQGQVGVYPYRQALWFYQSGNSGMIWESDRVSNNWLQVGGSGPISAANGQIYVLDPINQCVMAYDPAGGGMHQIANSTLLGGNTGNGWTQTGTAAATMAAPSTSYVTTLTTTQAYGIGSVIRDGSRVADDGVVVGVTSNTVKSYQVLRGFPSQQAVGFAQWNNSDNLQYQGGGPRRLVGKMVYDLDHGSLCYQPLGTVLKCGGAGSTTFDENQLNESLITRVRSRSAFSTGGANSGYLMTSLFDFGSSFDKYFRDVMWDGSLTQGLTTPWSENTGKVDLYYKLNDVPTDGNDTGLVLIQANATPRTRYAINVTGKSMSVYALIRSVTTATEFAANGLANADPIIRKISVRAAPIVPTYRQRTYEFALFENMALKTGTKLEPRTPAQLRADLEVLISANTPLSISDAGVTGMTAMFDLNATKIREMRPNEYVAYVTVREI